MPRLGVNIDHIATVRQARRTFEPDPVAGALAAEMAGAHGITLHVREDRRHVQERDLELVCRLCRTRVNLEMAAVKPMIELAKRHQPDVVSLVPEKREEITTEGGLDVAAALNIADIVAELKEAQIVPSAFIDPDTEQIEAAHQAGFPVIELHTGAYADATASERNDQLERLRLGAELAVSLGMSVAAGHGITYYNVKPLMQIADFEEYNIGHSIISRAILVGMDRAVREMLSLISQDDDSFDPANLFRNLTDTTDKIFD